MLGIAPDGRTAKYLVDEGLGRRHVLGRGTATANGVVSNDGHGGRWRQNRSKQAGPEQQGQGSRVRNEPRMRGVARVSRFGIGMRVQVFVQTIPTDPGTAPYQDTGSGDGVNGSESCNGQRGRPYLSGFLGQSFGPFHQSLRSRQPHDTESKAGDGRLDGVFREQVVIENVPGTSPKGSRSHAYAHVRGQHSGRLGAKDYVNHGGSGDGGGRMVPVGYKGLIEGGGGNGLHNGYHWSQFERKKGRNLATILYSVVPVVAKTRNKRRPKSTSSTLGEAYNDLPVTEQASRQLDGGRLSLLVQHHMVPPSIILPRCNAEEGAVVANRNLLGKWSDLIGPPPVECITSCQ